MRGNRDLDLSPIMYIMTFRKRSTSQRILRNNPLRKESLRETQDLLVNNLRDTLVHQFHTHRDALSFKLNVDINIHIIMHTIIFLYIIIMMVSILGMITIHLTPHLTCIINMHTFTHKHHTDLTILEMDTRVSAECAN